VEWGPLVGKAARREIWRALRRRDLNAARAKLLDRARTTASAGATPQWARTGRPNGARQRREYWVCVSRENVEMIERMLGQAQRNPAALYEILDEEVRWDVAALDVPDGGPTYHGPEGVRDFFRRWVGTFDEWGYEVGEVIDAGDSVVVQVRQWGRGKGSGVAVDQRFWQVWTIHDGKVIRGTFHTEEAEALEAAGLRR
jgi:ketosteroid isomerase-like protein